MATYRFISVLRKTAPNNTNQIWLDAYVRGAMRRPITREEAFKPPARVWRLIIRSASTPYYIVSGSYCTLVIVSCSPESLVMSTLSPTSTLAGVVQHICPSSFMALVKHCFPSTIT